ncbi:MAG: phosphodiester glycosidase family protein [Deltaproteobacteria bacterium]|nr:phosphodiester glycosidase family protein [Deltaproteobacteria bacterium]
MRPAHAVAQNVNHLAQHVRNVVADGVVTRAEKKGVLKEADKLEAKAETLTERQGDSVVDAVKALERMTANGNLALHADDAVRALIKSKDAMWKDAKAEMNHNPFPRSIGRAGHNGVKAPFEGVRTRDFTWEGKRVHFVAVDLANPKVKVSTTSEGERGKSVDSFAKKHHAELGINGDFFSYGSYKPSGMNMKNGREWGTAGATWESGLVWKGQHAQIQRSSSDPADWASNVVSARPMVLNDGRPVTHFPEPDKAAPNRRTGLGLSKDGRMLFLVAAEGGMSGNDLGRFLRQHGAHEGFALDSGGSAQLYQRGRGLVQRSSDPGGRRVVANALLINVG